mgnify:CR=1 FL=1
MLKSKATWALIVFVLLVAFIGGLDQKKTVDVESHGQVNLID